MTELKIEDTDLYELLGIESNCTIADVRIEIIIEAVYIKKIVYNRLKKRIEKKH